jgi:predicted nucleotidyltransferase component of viral defense system
MSDRRSQPAPSPAVPYGISAPVPAGYVAAWSELAPWRFSYQVEQDLLLTTALALIAEGPMRDRLSFRGGTCLHKLVFGRAWRYSEDLDFCLVGDGEAEAVALEVAGQLAAIGGEPHATQPGARRYTSGAEIKLEFPSSSAELNGGRIVVKIDINDQETAPYDPAGYDARRLIANLPSGYALDVPIQTFTLEELLATKLRALVTRGTPQGRDLLDIWIALTHERFDVQRTVGFFHHYLQAVGKRMAYPEIADRIAAAAVAPGVDADIETMCQTLPEGFSAEAARRLIERQILPAL